MRSTILNREFQHPRDGWYQIETPGEHLNTAGGVVQVIDSAAVSSIVNRFNQEADDYQRRTGQPFPGMVIDHEHFKHESDKESRAYGWLMRLQNRDGVPFGQINWTATGKPAIDGGDYRFFSSEYDAGDLQILNGAQKPVRARPMRLAGLSLTNMPNNKGGQPITNREAVPATAQISPAQASHDLLNRAKAIKATKGCTFDQAWNEAAGNTPMAAVANRSQRPAAPAMVRRYPSARAGAAQILTDLANAHKKQFNCPFDKSWNIVRNRYSALTKISNRLANDPEVGPADFKEACACEPAVLEQLQSEHTEPPDRGTNKSFSVGPNAGSITRCTFRFAIHQIMADDGLTLQEACDKLKADEPIFWTLAMLALNPEQ